MKLCANAPGCLNELSEVEFVASSLCSECRERKRAAAELTRAEEMFESMIDLYLEDMGVRAGGRELAIFRAVARTLSKQGN